MTDSGWKDPKTVAQDSRRELNNGLSCYQFSYLDTLKQADDHFAEQVPWAKTGVDTIHKSPMIYSYNYDFNLPSDATVSKITVFVKCQQLTHPKYYYEHYVLKRELRYSVSKFCNVKLKVGTSLVDGGSGNDFSDKCSSQMLPYQQWSDESMTTFSGTPEEWGLTGDNIVNIINNGNFGVVIQFIGTVKDGWVNPGIARIMMKVEYDTPAVNTLGDSKFEKITVTYRGEDIKFTNSKSEVIDTLIYDSYVNPILISFNFYHKGSAGETPIIIFESKSLIMGADAKAYYNEKTSTGKYTMNSIHCDDDADEKKYTQVLAVFPGTLLGEQTITYTLDGKKYTLVINVENPTLSVEERAKFLKEMQQCVIKNCVFFKNHAKGVGGANYITTEFYNASGNIYGINTLANTTENKNKQKKDCKNTFWLNECYTSQDK